MREVGKAQPALLLARHFILHIKLRFELRYVSITGLHR